MTAERRSKIGGLLGSALGAVPVPHLLTAAATAKPDQAALLVDGAGRLSFRDWETRATSLAHALVYRGVRPGHRVGLLFHERQIVDYAVGYFGVLNAGATTVLLHRGSDA